MKNLLVVGMLSCSLFSCAMQDNLTLKRKAESYLHVAKQQKIEKDSNNSPYMKIQEINSLYEQHEFEQDIGKLCNDFPKKITLQPCEELAKELVSKNHIVLRLYHKKTFEK